MKFYSITEMVGFNGNNVMTTNNHLKDKDEVFNMFLTRRDMLLKTREVEVLKDDYDVEEDWGLVKVKFPNGVTVEVAMCGTQLV